MIKQNRIEFESELIEPVQPFRTIHYLGSKLRVLEQLKEIVDELDPKKNGFLDLFAGSGSVSQYLSFDRKIVSVDIQNYSQVICSALLKPISDSFIHTFHEKVANSVFTSKYLSIFDSLIDLEENIINGQLSQNLDLVCNFLENASLYSAISNTPNNGSKKLKDAFTSSIQKLDIFDKNTFLATKYFGGIYFSYKQSVLLDVILTEIKKTDIKYHNILMASLLSTASDIVNTVGKQFAQPIRPRNKNGEPKKQLIKQLRKDRNLDVIKIFGQWINKYSKIKVSSENNEIQTMDYKEALEKVKDDIALVYADPPYTRDHYSRFYHVLETLSLVDYPLISTTNIGGFEHFSRGLYRKEREQSDFCIKSKAPKAFEQLFKLVSDKNKILLLSYSPYDKSKESHPRVVEIKLLESLALKYFSKVEIRPLGNFSHSKLNKTDLHLEAEKAAEVLIICQI